jgi:hypothetical protein
MDAKPDVTHLTRPNRSIEQARCSRSSRAVREIIHDDETFLFVNDCKSFRIPKLTSETVTEAETFQFQLFFYQIV